LLVCEENVLGACKKKKKSEKYVWVHSLTRYSTRNIHYESRSG
jgi:hypothetical protein